jgi:hypothetical protein
MVTVGGRRDGCSSDRALAIAKQLRLRSSFNGERQGLLLIWVLHGIFWRALALYAGNPQQAGKNYNDSSAANAAISQQARSPLKRPNTD